MAVGQIVFEHGSYHEIVILEDGDIKVILCVDGEEFKLYRLEAPETRLHHLARYTAANIIDSFHKAQVERDGYLKGN